MVSREDQIKFYADELKEYEFETKKIFNATAISLFDTGELYVGQFKGYDELRGNVFIDIPDNEISHSPRLDQRFTCFTLKAGQELPKVWGDMTFRDLLHDRIRTDSKIVDYIPSKREGWITMLIRDMDVLFLRELEHNQILGFGPTIPPYEYIENLLNLTRAIPAKFTGQRSWFDILFFKHDELIDERMPVLITEESDIPQVVTDSLVESDYFIFQGPPGSGKTHQIADLVSRLVLKGYSVLLTALTNKASAEVCEKSSFKSLLEENRVSKRPLSIEERRRFPKLLNAEELVPIRGHVHLSTYYQFSRIWKTSNETFDYIIVEEASQAFLTTIAAAKKVGKKVIVVGDPMQIVPIPNNNNYKALKNIELLVNGMSTLCRMPLLTFYRKVESRRLTERSVSYTNLFYENTIQSVPLYQDLDQDIKQLSSLSKVVHKFGGPVLILFPAKTKSVLSAMQHFLIESIDELSIIKNTQIAVLTPLIKTLTHLQKSLKSQTKSRKYLIDSVDRVQGLDVDYCFFVIEEPSSFSFNTNRFNVLPVAQRKVHSYSFRTITTRKLICLGRLSATWIGSDANLLFTAIGLRSLLVRAAGTRVCQMMFHVQSKRRSQELKWLVR